MILNEDTTFSGLTAEEKATIIKDQADKAKKAKQEALKVAEQEKKDKATAALNTDKCNAKKASNKKAAAISAAATVLAALGGLGGAAGGGKIAQSHGGNELLGAAGGAALGGATAAAAGAAGAALSKKAKKYDKEHVEAVNKAAKSQEDYDKQYPQTTEPALTESLTLYVDELSLTEGMCEDYIYMQLLDKNGFKINENNLSVLKEAFANGHIVLAERE